MAIEMKNHACKRDSVKTFSTEPKQYDNGQGTTLSRIKQNKCIGATMTQTEIPSKKILNIGRIERGVMTHLAVSPLDSTTFDMQDMVINHLAPSFLQYKRGEK